MLTPLGGPRIRERCPRHPFANSNGRCSRLVVDLYRYSIGSPFLPWGGEAVSLDN